MSIPEWVAIIALGAILAIIGWGFRRMVDTQDAMAANVSTMTLDIAKLCGKIEMAELVRLQDRRICDDRHNENNLKHSENLARLKEISQDIRNIG